MSQQRKSPKAPPPRLLGTSPSNQLPQEVIEAARDKRVIVMMWLDEEGTLMSIINDDYINQNSTASVSRQLTDVLIDNIGDNVIVDKTI